jgi:hypothetical protein
MSDNDLLDAHLRLPEHVVHRSFATETVVLNLRTGKYHGLNPMAGSMLDLLEGGASVREVATQVATSYGRDQDSIEADVIAFCRELLERNLVEMAPDEPG